VPYECDQIYPRDHRAERDRSGLCAAHAELTRIAVIESHVAEYAGHQSKRAAGISDAAEPEYAAERLERRFETWMRASSVRGRNPARTRGSWQLLRG
jgi:hypothetical protein